MDNINSALLNIEDIDQSFLPGGVFDANSEDHYKRVLNKFQRDGGADGLFTDVQFDGLVIQIALNEKAEEEFNDCMELLQLGGYKPAIHRMTPLLENYPYHIHLLYNLGMALRETGKLEDSIDILSRATEINPSHTHCWVALAVSYQTASNEQAALKAAESAFALDREDPFVLRTLGYILESMGEIEKAETHLERVLILSPTDAQTHLVLGKIKSSTSPKIAKAHFDKVLEYAPATALSSLASSLLEDL